MKSMPKSTAFNNEIIIYRSVRDRCHRIVWKYVFICARKQNDEIKIADNNVLLECCISLFVYGISGSIIRIELK